MCGFAGVVYLRDARSPSSELLTRMSESISHRGPDGSGIYRDGGVGLAHRRLAVIDPNFGAQPMTDDLTSRTIVFNGEIYNYQELRGEAQRDGRGLRTASDTEVLLKLSTVDSTDWLSKLNGMFAFALWDARKRKLLLVRDRFGVKPLYVVRTSDFVAFASEAKALLHVLTEPPSICTDGLQEYLAFRHVLAPKTLFKNIGQICPGTAWTIDLADGRVQETTYWSEHAETMGRPLDEEESQAQFAERFSSAVRYRMIADVPVGTFNSGGVDSTLVTAEVRRQKATELHTYSVGFNEAEYDETEYAALVAERLGTIHTAVRVDGRRYAELWARAVWHLDAPLCHAHSVQILSLSEIAKRDVTVVLTGEGADEVFGGYPRLQIPMLIEQMPLPLKGVARRVSQWLTVHQSLKRRAAKFADVMASKGAPAVEALRFVPLRDLALLTVGAGGRSRDQMWKSLVGKDDFLRALLEFDRRAYLPSLLVRLDKMSMAHGLEARTPFLDYRLVLWSRRCPSALLMRTGRDNKVMLKRAAAAILPAQLVHRRKVGFGVPIGQWFRDVPELTDVLHQILAANSTACSIVDRRILQKMIDDHLSGRQDHAEVLWTLSNLEVWRHVFLSGMWRPT